VATLATLIVALALVANRKALSWLLLDRDDAKAVQCSHTGDPLRLGGIAIFVGILAGIMVGPWQSAVLPLLLVGSAIPAVVAGLIEDLGHGASPRQRLAAAFVSAVLASLLLGTWVSRADLPALDNFMAMAPVGFLLTVLVSAGFCHATNLVDGMNGLAAVVIGAAASGLALLARDAGQADLAMMAALLGAAAAGFFLLNWPFGKIFLGDAGSYGVGHVLIWIAIVLADRSPDIAVPALLLILFWPFADTLHSIGRRLSDGAPVFSPDRMNLHQKLRRCIEIALLGGAHRRLSNPLATLVAAPMIVAPVIAGVALAHDASGAWIALAIFATLFALTHVAITRLAVSRRRMGPRTSFVAPQVYSTLSRRFSDHGRKI
jgi:UDP-N-acetylmuramyl pentapeptide phosphotransferase/UDP-N-acetylglucosamine-1-phosphate transferase